MQTQTPLLPPPPSPSHTPHTNCRACELHNHTHLNPATPLQRLTPAASPSPPPTHPLQVIIQRLQADAAAAREAAKQEAAAGVAAQVCVWEGGGLLRAMMVVVVGAGALGEGGAGGGTGVCLWEGASVRCIKMHGPCPDTYDEDQSALQAQPLRLSERSPSTYC